MVIKRREDYGGPGMTEHAVAFFFISYVLINSIMLLNVVVAVLLDEFISSVSREKEEDEKRERIERNKKKVAGFLDALTGTLLSDLIPLGSPHPGCSVKGLDSGQIEGQEVHIIESDRASLTAFRVQRSSSLSRTTMTWPYGFRPSGRQAQTYCGKLSNSLSCVS